MHGSTLTVLTTAVSWPTQDRAILDAGSKTLTSGPFRLHGDGMLPAYPDADITGLSDEHGSVNLRRCVNRPKIADKVQVIPNHCCPVSNLTDRVIFRRNSAVIRAAGVVARGCVT